MYKPEMMALGPYKALLYSLCSLGMGRFQHTDLALNFYVQLFPPIVLLAQEEM